MNGIFTFRRSDELSLNLKLDGATALDCSYMGKSLLFADSSDYIRLNIESGDVVRRKRSTHKIVRILKCHPRIVNNFVAIVGLFRSKLVNYLLGRIKCGILAKFHIK
jgi:hypothetical protein